jgi:hypothetical protein
VTGLLGEVARRHRFALVRVQCAQEPDRERAGRAEPRPRRDVRHAHDLQRGPDGVELECRPDDRMLDLVDAVDALQRGVLQEVVVGERPVDRDIDVSVDIAGEMTKPPCRE